MPARKQNIDLHPAQQYIEDVLSGKVLVCQVVKDACARHVKELEEAAKGKSDYVFNPAYPLHVIQFFTAIKHYKGEYAGRPFTLEPWQQFIVWYCFGWRKSTANGSRKVRQVYIEVPKKNGKSTFLAGICLYMAFFDNEHAADVYTAATKREQAKITWNDARNFVKNNSDLNKALTIQSNSIFSSATESFIKPLSAEHDTSDGINVHCAVIDELHRHKSSEMIDLLEASVSARRQPMVWSITTAGTNRQSICYEHHSYTKLVNSGKKIDPSWFGLIFSLDDTDDWREPKNWLKANPNLGTGKSREYLEARVLKARNQPRLENSIKRYEFNIWTGAEEKWLSSENWESIAVKRSDAELISPDVKCYGGLDLASKKDFNALSLLFINEAEGWRYFKHYYWCPKDMVDSRVQRNNIGYDIWVQEKWLQLVPGNVVDPETLGGDIVTILDKYQVISTAYDPYIATHGTVQRIIKAGHTAEVISQGYRTLSEPTKLLEADIMSGKVQHEGNPVTGWMVDNVVVYTDPNENIKLKKKSNDSPDKIDGAVAAVMAYAQYIDDLYKEEEEDFSDLSIILID